VANHGDLVSPMVETVVRGPYFEELRVGQVFDGAPAVTLTGGLAASHQAILGDRLRLPLSEPLAARVAGRAPLAHPALVWNVAIGQSTLVTQHVRANLFYRGLVLQRLPQLGDTLHTVTVIDGLRQNTVRAGRPNTGMALLNIRTSDQDGRAVLNFQRCAMIPLADPALDTGRRDDLGGPDRDLDGAELLSSVAGWRLPPPSQPLPRAGQRFRIGGADVVSGAPELARLTLNIAAVHHDAVAAGGRRLVYGGHTIGLALAQACRALPELITVLGWQSCDHLGPVGEGDRLTSTVDVARVDPAPTGGHIVQLRSQVSASDPDGGQPRDVLDWRFVALLP
jgi:acyl dehydratase